MTSGRDALFAVCQVGMESQIKAELALDGFKPAFSKPGFLTFKSEAPIDPKLRIESVFIRMYGLSYGKAKSPEEVLGLGLPLERASQWRLHVWERDRFVPGEEPPAARPDPRVGEWRSALLAARPELFLADEKAEDGDHVIDVVFADEGPAWVGMHKHRDGLFLPWPGAKPPLTLPPGAPSRAWLKMEEALLVSRAPIEKGDVVLEIGSAPGGASFSLLNRGLRVIGIDPGEMAENVAKHPCFSHLRKPFSTIARSELPPKIHWFVLDMNLAPQAALNAVERFAPHAGADWKGVLLTLKLNEKSFADEIPDLLERVRKIGLVQVRAKQLAFNRREFFVCGLTRKEKLVR